MIERGEIIETWERENTRLCENGTRAIFAMSPSITAPRGGEHGSALLRETETRQRRDGEFIVIIIIIVIVIVIVTG